MKRMVATILPALTLIFALLYVATSAKLAQDNSPQREAVPDALFLKNCASCRGKDGRAKTFKAKIKHARDLTDAKWQMAITDEHIYESILKGKGKMPAFEKKLSGADIAALASYVRTLKK